MKSTLLSAILGLGMAGGLLAQPVGWNRAIPITVTENSGTLVTNYQLRLTLDTQTPISNGEMLPTGDDIRFGKDCIGSTLYNYWIESGLNTPNTVVWVKVDTLAASSSKEMYWFFGNATATAASAVPGTFIGPHSSTDSVASGGAGGVGNSQRGFRFAPNEDLLVTSFGKREPTGTTRYVTLFDFATQAILAQTQVSGPSAQYSYSNLTNPIWLTSGTQYVLELFQGSGDGYYFGTSSQIGQHLTYFDMKYCNSCTQNTFPTSTLTNYHYGYPDLWYFTKKNVSPAPSYAVGSAIMVDGSPAQNFCPGSSALLTFTSANVVGGYTTAWTPPSGLTPINADSVWASPASNTCYEIRLTDSRGCWAADSICVTPLAAPGVDAGWDTTVCPNSAIVLNGVSSTGNCLWSPGNLLNDSTSCNPIATINGPTQFILSVTDSTGCSNWDTVFVTAYPQPTIQITGDSVLCEGDTASLHVSGDGFYYSWTPATHLSCAVCPDPFAFPSSTETYSVISSDSNGCEVFGSWTVTVNPLPSVSFTLDSLYCIWETNVTLVGTPAGGTFSGPGVTGTNFDPSVAGLGTHMLFYTYSDSVGCSNSTQTQTVVDICENRPEGMTLKTITWPNPFHDQLSLEIPNQNGPVQVEVFNLLGEKMASVIKTNGTLTLPTQTWPAGTYFLKATGTQGNATLKVVKE